MAKRLSGNLVGGSGSGGGGGAVESVNSQTGAVSLGIDNLDDVQFNVTTNATVYEFTYAGTSGYPASGEHKVILNPNTSPPSTDKLRISQTDANGLSVPSFTQGNTVWISADQVNYSTVTAASGTGSTSGHYILSLSSSDEDVYDSLSIAIGGTLYLSNTDPNPQTVNPSNGEVLQYDTASSKFKPASAVNSVNSLTGAVSLGVEELNDFALNQELNLDYSTWSADNTPSAGEWHINSNFFYLPKVDANGTDHSSNFRALDGTTALTITQGSTDYVITNATLYADQLDDTYQRAFITSGSSPGGLIATIDSQITKSGAISIASSSFSGSPVALANGDILHYNSTDSKFKPAQLSVVAPVSSVNTLTGAVSLGIEDLDDFALNTGAASVTHPTRDVTVDQAGEWNAFDSGSGAVFQWGNTGSLHTEMLKLQSGDSVTFNFGSGDENHTISTAPSVNNSNSYYLRVTATAWTSTMPATGSSCTVTSTRFNPATIALADGDILQYNSTDSKFKPAQAAGVRSLLGIGEYADDTAAGSGGLSSGELYYNTTSSSYVLKT